MAAGLVLLGAAAHASGCAGLSAVRQHWAGDLRAKNLDASAALYTPDGTFFDPSATAVQGRQAIRRLFATVTQRFDSQITLVSQATQCAGFWASDQGAYTETLIDRARRTTQHLHGNYLMVLARAPDGQWRIAAQMWTGAPDAPR